MSRFQITNIRRISGALCTVILMATARAALAQQSLPELSLEELMLIDSGRVFGASERIQPVTEAPASVSFITAEEIARYGYRTLADILRGVRGMYVTDDRNFSLLGTRGLAKPGDYNSRILLLVNGHRVNDNVFGQAEIGAEFGIDPAMFERVEIIRGPASSLYGDSAFFAVVNVITKSGASLDGKSVAIEGGSLGTLLTRFSVGRLLPSGIEVVGSATMEQSTGVQRLYFPAWDSPATNNGIAEGLDGERVGQFYGQVRFKSLSFTGAYGRRRRDVPTASFQTVFNEQQASEQTTDRHALADLEYGRSFGVNNVVIRGSFDQFSYRGIYPRVPPVDPPTDGTGELSSVTDPIEIGDPVPVDINRNSVLGSRWTVGVRLTRPLRGRQTVTTGAEFIDNIHQDQRADLIKPPLTELFSLNQSSIQGAVYLQDEIKLARWLIATVGLRYDRYEDFKRLTPRAAVILTPSSNQSFKYLYGRAFRAPNIYELNDALFGPGVKNLHPESIDTHEFVWERYTNDWLRTSVSAYRYDAIGLITSIQVPDTLLFSTFINDVHARANGLELEAQMRLSGGLQGLVSYALQSTKNVATGNSVVNSPRQMAKARFSVHGPLKLSTVSFEMLAMSSRLTRNNARLAPATTFGVTMIAPMGNNFDLIGSVRNLFNADYSDPVSVEHQQDAIPQNGRTFRVGLRWRLASKKAAVVDPAR